MRFHSTPIAIAAFLAGSGIAAAQALVCPPAASTATRACETFHYHVAMYRPDTRQFAEFDAVNQFASQSACDRARDAEMQRNLAAVAVLKKRDDRYEPNRVGPCHCDATRDNTSVMYRSDAQRVAQVRTYEDVRQRVRERLLDAGVASDADVVRGVVAIPPPAPQLGGTKLPPIPPPAALTTASLSSNDLKMTKAVNDAPQSTIAVELPLVDPLAPATASPAAPPVAIAEATPPASTTPASQPATPATQPAAQPAAVAQPVAAQPTTPPPTQPAAAPADPAPAAMPTAIVKEEPQPVPELASDAAESFVSYETQRIDKVLEASGAINDDNLKARVLEACTQRVQLLSNLRALIEGSGVHSKLATAALAAKSEEDRLALVAKLFGSDMPKHWAPRDAADVVIDADVADAEKVLRDNAGHFDAEQKRHALYQLLAHTQPTEEQQLWLTNVVDGFLRGV